MVSEDAVGADLRRQSPGHSLPFLEGGARPMNSKSRSLPRSSCQTLAWRLQIERAVRYPDPIWYQPPPSPRRCGPACVATCASMRRIPFVFCGRRRGAWTHRHRRSKRGHVITPERWECGTRPGNARSGS